MTTLLGFHRKNNDDPFGISEEKYDRRTDYDKRKAMTTPTASSLFGGGGGHDNILATRKTTMQAEVVRDGLCIDVFPLPAWTVHI